MAEGDAVEQARAWLAEHGEVVPPPAPSATRTAVDRTGSTWSGPDSDADEQPAEPAAGFSSVGADEEEDGEPEARGKGAKRRRRAEDDEDADPESVARTIVLRKLAAQARTRHELAKALAQREVPEDVAAHVLDRMEAVGLVDDAAFARDWVRSRQQRRHLSASALRRELQNKGVDREQVDEALSDVETGDELVAAETLAEKKLRTMTGLERDVQYRRLAGALARRGFSAGVTSTVLRRVLDTSSS